MKGNICVIGLVKSYTKNIAKKVSDKLDMFFGDLDELMEFDLIDLNNVKNICGQEYVDKVEQSKMKMLVSFENTLSTFNYSLLNNKNNLNNIKSKSIIIFIKLNKVNAKNKLIRAGVKKDDLNLQLDLLNERNKLCEKYADIVVDANDLSINKVISNIKEQLLNFMLKE